MIVFSIGRLTEAGDNIHIEGDAPDVESATTSVDRLLAGLPAPAPPISYQGPDPEP